MTIDKERKKSAFYFASVVSSLLLEDYKIDIVVQLSSFFAIRYRINCVGIACVPTNLIVIFQSNDPDERSLSDISRKIVNSFVFAIFNFMPFFMILFERENRKKSFLNFFWILL